MAKYKVKLDGKDYEVSVVDKGSGATVTVEGRSFEVQPAISREASAPAATAVVPTPAAAPARRSSAPVGGGSGTVCAPIPGVVTKVLVSVGDAVTIGQVVLKLEAMKMENDIATPVAGSVKEISVVDGTEVKDGQLLLVIE